MSASDSGAYVAHPPDCPCQQAKPSIAVTSAEVEVCSPCVRWAADLYRQGRKAEWADFRVVHAVLHRSEANARQASPASPDSPSPEAT